MEILNSFKQRIKNVSNKNFQNLALDIFNFQYINNPIYKSYLDSLKVNPKSINNISQIPYLPISFFKSHKISIINQHSPIYFTSSGTTGVSKSHHYIPDPLWYKQISEKGFQLEFGPLEDYIFIAFLPSYQENPNSSLIYMINNFIEKSQSDLSCYISSPQELNALKSSLKDLNKKVFFIGVSYALFDLAETGIDLSDWKIMETGGMKGRKKEMVRNELHEILKTGLKASEIYSEYGMTELLSQAYSRVNGIMNCPPWMKVSTREINDPFNEITNRTGVLKIIDLANIYSCSFIETEDIGIVQSNGSFEILGRLDNSDARGCNLLYTR